LRLRREVECRRTPGERADERALKRCNTVSKPGRVKEERVAQNGYGSRRRNGLYTGNG
jgi:hypothetical protein